MKRVAIVLLVTACGRGDTRLAAGAPPRSTVAPADAAVAAAAPLAVAFEQLHQIGGSDHALDVLYLSRERLASCGVSKPARSHVRLEVDGEGQVVDVSVGQLEARGCLERELGRFRFPRNLRRYELSAALVFGT